MSQELDKLSLMFGEIKSTLDHLDKKIDSLSTKYERDLDKLQERVTKLEQERARLYGIMSAVGFVCAFVIPLLQKKLGM